MNHRSNSRFASRIATEVPDAASWQAFDALPAEMRRELWQSPVSVSPISCAALVKEAGVTQAVRMIREAMANELLRFGADHLKHHGYPLPHLAANVTVQRYVAAGSEF